jgi:hypothetical protein
VVGRCRQLVIFCHTRRSRHQRRSDRLGVHLLYTSGCR